MKKPIIKVKDIASIKEKFIEGRKNPTKQAVTTNTWSIQIPNTDVVSNIMSLKLRLEAWAFREKQAYANTHVKELASTSIQVDNFVPKILNTQDVKIHSLLLNETAKQYNNTLIELQHLINMYTTDPLSMQVYNNLESIESINTKLKSQHIASNNLYLSSNPKENSTLDIFVAKVACLYNTLPDIVKEGLDRSSGLYKRMTDTLNSNIVNSELEDKTGTNFLGSIFNNNILDTTNDRQKVYKYLSAKCNTKEFMIGSTINRFTEIIPYQIYNKNVQGKDKLVRTSYNKDNQGVNKRYANYVPKQLKMSGDTPNINITDTMNSSIEDALSTTVDKSLEDIINETFSFDKKWKAYTGKANRLNLYTSGNTFNYQQPLISASYIFLQSFETLLYGILKGDLYVDFYKNVKVNTYNMSPEVFSTHPNNQIYSNITHKFSCLNTPISVYGEFYGNDTLLFSKNEYNIDDKVAHCDIVYTKEDAKALAEETDELRKALKTDALKLLLFKGMGNTDIDVNHTQMGGVRDPYNLDTRLYIEEEYIAGSAIALLDVISNMCGVDNTLEYVAYLISMFDYYTIKLTEMNINIDTYVYSYPMCQAVIQPDSEIFDLSYDYKVNKKHVDKVEKTLPKKYVRNLEQKALYKLMYSMLTFLNTWAGAKTGVRTELRKKACLSFEAPYKGYLINNPVYERTGRVGVQSSNIHNFIKSVVNYDNIIDSEALIVKQNIDSNVYNSVWDAYWGKYTNEYTNNIHNQIKADKIVSYNPLNSVFRNIYKLFRYSHVDMLNIMGYGHLYSRLKIPSNIMYYHKLHENSGINGANRNKISNYQHSFYKEDTVIGPVKTRYLMSLIRPSKVALKTLEHTYRMYYKTPILMLFNIDMINNDKVLTRCNTKEMVMKYFRPRGIPLLNLFSMSNKYLYNYTLPSYTLLYGDDNYLNKHFTIRDVNMLNVGKIPWYAEEKTIPLSSELIEIAMVSDYGIGDMPMRYNIKSIQDINLDYATIAPTISLHNYMLLNEISPVELLDYSTNNIGILNNVQSLQKALVSKYMNNICLSNDYVNIIDLNKNARFLLDTKFSTYQASSVEAEYFNILIGTNVNIDKLNNCYFNAIGFNKIQEAFKQGEASIENIHSLQFIYQDKLGESSLGLNPAMTGIYTPAFNYVNYDDAKFKQFINDTYTIYSTLRNHQTEAVDVLTKAIERELGDIYNEESVSKDILNNVDFTHYIDTAYMDTTNGNNDLVNIANIVKTNISNTTIHGLNRVMECVQTQLKPMLYFVKKAAIDNILECGIYIKQDGDLYYIPNEYNIFSNSVDNTNSIINDIYISRRTNTFSSKQDIKDYIIYLFKQVYDREPINETDYVFSLIDKDIFYSKDFYRLGVIDIPANSYKVTQLTYKDLFISDDAESYYAGDDVSFRHLFIGGEGTRVSNNPALEQFDVHVKDRYFNDCGIPGSYRAELRDVTFTGKKRIDNTLLDTESGTYKALNNDDFLMKRVKCIKGNYVEGLYNPEQTLIDVDIDTGHKSSTTLNAIGFNRREIWDTLLETLNKRVTYIKEQGTFLLQLNKIFDYQKFIEDCNNFSSKMVSVDNIENLSFIEYFLHAALLEAMAVTVYMYNAANNVIPQKVAEFKQWFISNLQENQGHVPDSFHYPYVSSNEDEYFVGFLKDEDPCDLLYMIPIIMYSITLKSLGLFTDKETNVYNKPTYVTAKQTAPEDTPIPNLIRDIVEGIPTILRPNIYDTVLSSENLIEANTNKLKYYLDFIKLLSNTWNDLENTKKYNELKEEVIQKNIDVFFSKKASNHKETFVDLSFNALEYLADLDILPVDFEAILYDLNYVYTGYINNISDYTYSLGSILKSISGNLIDGKALSQTTVRICMIMTLLTNLKLYNDDLKTCSIESASATYYNVDNTRENIKQGEILYTLNNADSITEWEAEKSKQRTYCDHLDMVSNMHRLYRVISMGITESVNYDYIELNTDNILKQQIQTLSALMLEKYDVDRGTGDRETNNSDETNIAAKYAALAIFYTKASPYDKYRKAIDSTGVLKGDNYYIDIENSIRKISVYNKCLKHIDIINRHVAYRESIMLNLSLLKEAQNELNSLYIDPSKSIDESFKDYMQNFDSGNDNRDILLHYYMKPLYTPGLSMLRLAHKLVSNNRGLSNKGMYLNYAILKDNATNLMSNSNYAGEKYILQNNSNSAYSQLVHKYSPNDSKVNTKHTIYNSAVYPALLPSLSPTENTLISTSPTYNAPEYLKYFKSVSVLDKFIYNIETKVRDNKLDILPSMINTYFGWKHRYLTNGYKDIYLLSDIPSLLLSYISSTTKIKEVQEGNKYTFKKKSTISKSASKKNKYSIKKMVEQNTDTIDTLSSIVANLDKDWNTINDKLQTIVTDISQKDEIIKDTVTDLIKPRVLPNNVFTYSNDSHPFWTAYLPALIEAKGDNTKITRVLGEILTPWVYKIVDFIKLCTTNYNANVDPLISNPSLRPDYNRSTTLNNPTDNKNSIFGYPEKDVLTRIVDDIIYEDNKFTNYINYIYKNVKCNGTDRFIEIMTQLHKGIINLIKVSLFTNLSIAKGLLFTKPNAYKNKVVDIKDTIDTDLVLIYTTLTDALSVDTIYHKPLKLKLLDITIGKLISELDIAISDSENIDNKLQGVLTLENGEQYNTLFDLSNFTVGAVLNNIVSILDGEIPNVINNNIVEVTSGIIDEICNVIDIKYIHTTKFKPFYTYINKDIRITNKKNNSLLLHDIGSNNLTVDVTDKSLSAFLYDEGLPSKQLNVLTVWNAEVPNIVYPVIYYYGMHIGVPCVYIMQGLDNYDFTLENTNYMELLRTTLGRQDIVIGERGINERGAEKCRDSLISQVFKDNNIFTCLFTWSYSKLSMFDKNNRHIDEDVDVLGLKPYKDTDIMIIKKYLEGNQNIEVILNNANHNKSSIGNNTSNKIIPDSTDTFETVTIKNVVSRSNDDTIQPLSSLVDYPYILGTCSKSYRYIYKDGLCTTLLMAFIPPSTPANRFMLYTTDNVSPKLNISGIMSYNIQLVSTLDRVRHIIYPTSILVNAGNVDISQIVPKINDVPIDNMLLHSVTNNDAFQVLTLPILVDSQFDNKILPQFKTINTTISNYDVEQENGSTYDYGIYVTNPLVRFLEANITRQVNNDDNDSHLDHASTTKLADLIYNKDYVRRSQTAYTSKETSELFKAKRVSLGLNKVQYNNMAYRKMLSDIDSSTLLYTLNTDVTDYAKIATMGSIKSIDQIFTKNDINSYIGILSGRLSDNEICDIVKYLLHDIHYFGIFEIREYLNRYYTLLSKTRRYFNNIENDDDIWTEDKEQLRKIHEDFEGLLLSNTGHVHKYNRGE